MKKKGWVEKTPEGWNITKQGSEALSSKNRFELIASPFTKDAARKTIIAFDIPESKRLERVWLRNQLKAFGYIMLQKSLWQGPGPLPKEFAERLKELKIASGVKTFTVASK